MFYTTQRKSLRCLLSMLSVTLTAFCLQGKMMPRTFRIEANMDAPDSIADFRTTLLASYSLDDMEFSANLRTPEVNRRITGKTSILVVVFI